ncbi:MAG TPA: ChaN family lipoprotein, partial [bacterium]
MRRPLFLGLVTGLIAALAGCIPSAPDAPRGFAFRVPPATTYDLTRAKPLTPEEQAQRLQGVRLLFVGEHHDEARSHAAQLELLQTLQSRGRLITVALEMFPPDADGALDEWRQGRLEEAEFLERSGWYESWGHPWRYYRSLFIWFREQQIPLRGVNVDKATRIAARVDKPQDLPQATQEEVGDLREVLEPHRDFLLAQLRSAGHAGDLNPDSPQFKSFLRVQMLWERAMGRRAARLAEELPPNGIVVVLIGSGHLGYKLG